MPEDQALVDQAIEMLKNEPMRAFRIEIAADSLVQTDEIQEKKDRMEMLEAIGAYLQKSLPVIQSSPEVAPMLIELMKFGVTAFKVGKSVEGMIDQTLDDIKQSIEAKKGQPPEPSPEQLKIQAQQQGDAAKLQAKTQADQMALQANQQMEQMRLQAERQAEQQRMMFEAQMERERLASDERAGQMTAMFDQQFARWKAELEAATKIEVANIGAKVKTDDNATKAAEREVSQEVQP